MIGNPNLLKLIIIQNLPYMETITTLREGREKSSTPLREVDRTGLCVFHASLATFTESGWVRAAPELRGHLA